MVTLHPEKICVIPYVDKDDPTISFSMTFKFPYTQDMPIDEKNEEHPIAYILRIAQKSIIKTEGIIDSTTNCEIVLTDNNRKLLYDMIKTMPEYVYKISAAYMGPKGKNWLTGVMELLTTDGHPTNVLPASQPVSDTVSLSATTGV
jgi:hypothetical protein